MKKKVHMHENKVEDIRRAIQGDKEALERLVEQNSGLVWNIVKRFLQRGYEAEDLYQIGCIGLIKAIKRFDLSYEVQLSTYAVPYILGEIKRFIRDDGLIRVSRSTKELAVKIKGLQREHLANTGEEISLAEIAKKLNITKEEVAASLDSLNPVESIYKEETKDENGRYLLDKIASNKDEQNRITNRLTIQGMIQELDTREKEIIMLRYYKEKTQSQVGKILGISQVQVSRIEKRILEKMKTKWEAV